VEGTGRKNSRHPLTPEKRRYLRFMQVGLSFWLAILPAMMLAAMYNLYQIMTIVPVFLYIIGSLIFFIGYVGRQELKERNR
jgi:hypothetical protein